MAKENTIVYVDLSRPSSVMSNITYNQGKKFNAYTDIQEGRTTFVNFEEIIRTLGMEEATKIIKAVAGDK